MCLVDIIYDMYEKKEGKNFEGDPSIPFTAATDLRIELFYESTAFVSFPQTEIEMEEPKEGEMPKRSFSLQLLRSEFDEKCADVTERIVKSTKEYVTSRENLPEALILMGEAVLVKNLMRELEVTLSEHSVKILSVFTPPLVGVLGAAVDGLKREEITGQRFEMLFKEETNTGFDGEGFFGFGMLPLSIGVEVDGGLFKKALYQFQ